MTSRDHRVLAATCQLHRGCIGFTNLMVTHDPATGQIVFDPHVDQSCVLTLDRTSASMLHETLGEWLAGQ